MGTCPRSTRMMSSAAVMHPCHRGLAHPRRRKSAATSDNGIVSRVSPVQTAVRNCMRDEGGPFEVGNQVLISSHRKLLSSKAMVVNVAESRNKISAGMIERGERKRTADDVAESDWAM